MRTFIFALTMLAKTSIVGWIGWGAYQLGQEVTATFFLTLSLAALLLTPPLLWLSQKQRI